MSEKIEKFEDFIAWQKARKLTSEIYKTTKIGRFASDFGLKDQIQRAAVSIMSNIAEGFERGRPSEFLSVAKASCAELRSQLYVALDVNYLSQEAFASLMKQAIEVGQVVGGLRVAVAHRRNIR